MRLLFVCSSLVCLIGCGTGKESSNRDGSAKPVQSGSSSAAGSRAVLSATESDLANAAQSILKEHCYSCHGEGGSNEGGFNYVLNRRRLTRELVSPGAPDDSKLFERIVKGQMPPDGDPIASSAVNTLRKWIEAGAPPFAAETPPTFIGQSDMVGFMKKDLEQSAERDRPFLRYLTLTHLYNAGFQDNELESHRHGVSKLLNSLSWGREIHVPQPIDPDRTILRIDLRHYKWNENNAWTKIIAADPYRINYSDEATRSCYSMAKCEVPHTRADWFVFAASRPPLYHEVLGIPERVESLEEKLGVNVARNLIDFNGVQRAAFSSSGVSKSNRLIERHPSNHGAYWKSYDFKPIDASEKTPKRRDLKEHPLGPTACGAVTETRKLFEHDGGEIIFHLPNGLQGYMLVDAMGNRIDKGPTDVVVDKEAVKRGRDPEVVNGVSCMSCHWSGMLNKTDQIRDIVLARQASFAAPEVEAVSALYSSKPDFAEKLKDDRARFELAVRQCGAPLTRSEPVSTLAYQFDEPIDVDLAAAELGVQTAQLEAALNRNQTLGLTLGSLTLGQTIPRAKYVNAFRSLTEELGVTPISTSQSTAATSRAAQEATAKNGPKLIMSKSTGMKLTLIPTGKFTMGSPDAHPTSPDGPQHTVEISPFYLGIYEVTQSEYEQVMAVNPSEFSKSGKNSTHVNGQDTREYPVENISWYDAIEFCNKLSEKDGLSPNYDLTNVQSESGEITSATVSVRAKNGYRLPTEAEWEYACRANTTTQLNFGMLYGDEANAGNFLGSGLRRTTKVGSYAKNNFGLFDMHGNVREWCVDYYMESAYYYRAEATKDPIVNGGDGTRAVRGGSWELSIGNAGSAYRGYASRGWRDNAIGFRIVR